MATATPVRDKRRIENRPLNARQTKALKFLAKKDDVVTTDVVADKVMKGEAWAQDKARGTLLQLRDRGLVKGIAPKKVRDSWRWSATAKGTKLVTK